MASLKNLLKFVLCMYLIVSSNAIVFRQATEREYEVFQRASQFSYVVMDSINPEDFKPKSTNVALRKNAVDPVVAAYVIIKAVCYLWKGIVALFGHSVSVTYTEVPMDKGYSELSQKIRVEYFGDIIGGENCANLEYLAKTLCFLVNIDENGEQCQPIIRAFDQAKYSDAKLWGKKEIGFQDSGDYGNVTYISVMVSHEVDDEYRPPECPAETNESPLCADHERFNALFLYMRAKLKLSEKVYIERKEEHWGIFREKVTSKIVTEKRGVEKEDIDTLFRFFGLVALKSLTSYFGVHDVELPQIQTAPQ